LRLEATRQGRAARVMYSSTDTRKFPFWLQFSLPVITSCHFQFYQIKSNQIYFLVA